LLYLQKRSLLRRDSWLGLVAASGGFGFCAYETFVVFLISVEIDQDPS
jgi:hypothetical protein